MVSWASMLQKIVALYTTEIEYVVTIEASKKMIWLYNFLVDLSKKVRK